MVLLYVGAFSWAERGTWACHMSCRSGGPNRTYVSHQTKPHSWIMGTTGNQFFVQLFWAVWRMPIEQMNFDHWETLLCENCFTLERFHEQMSCRSGGPNRTYVSHQTKPHSWIMGTTGNLNPLFNCSERCEECLLNRWISITEKLCSAKIVLRWSIFMSRTWHVGVPRVLQIRWPWSYICMSVTRQNHTAGSWDHPAILIYCSTTLSRVIDFCRTTGFRAMRQCRNNSDQDRRYDRHHLQFKAPDMSIGLRPLEADRPEGPGQGPALHMFARHDTFAVMFKPF